MIRRWLFALVFVLFVPTGALAQCTFNITPVAFGNVNVITGGAVDIIATLEISCTGLALLRRICPSIAAGSGGATSTARQMKGPGGAILNYQLYSDATRSTIWGSYDWGFSPRPPTIDTTLGLGQSTTRPIYARVFTGQTTVPPGSYISNFTAADTNFIYAQLLGVTACPNLLAPQQAHPTFTVTATVVPTCLVATQDVDFGTRGLLSSNVDATGQLAVTCTATTSYTVGLNGGNANGPPTARKMSKGLQTVTYGLYRDAPRSLPWGDTVGNTLAGTGSGLAQPLTVYGRVPPQTTPSPGLYTDTIVSTVTY